MDWMQKTGSDEWQSVDSAEDLAKLFYIITRLREVAHMIGTLKHGWFQVQYDRSSHVRNANRDLILCSPLIGEEPDDAQYVIL